MEERTEESKMSKQPNKSNANDLAAETTQSRKIVTPGRRFDRWLEKELERLEDQFEDFQTAKSTRVYFSR